MLPHVCLTRVPVSTPLQKMEPKRPPMLFGGHPFGEPLVSPSSVGLLFLHGRKGQSLGPLAMVFQNPFDHRCPFGKIDGPGR